MARDDLFRRSFEAGTAFLDMTRERAEALVKELVKAGELQKGKAQKAIDELLERSRKGTEELRELIRREIAEQVSALGLATKDDVARLEARLGDSTAAQEPTPAPEPTKAAGLKKAGPAAKTTAGGPAKKTKAAGPAEKATATKATATKATATKGTAATGAGTVRKAPPAKASAKAATKAGSARKKGASGPLATGGAGVTGSAGITASPPPDGV